MGSGLGTTVGSPKWSFSQTLSWLFSQISTVSSREKTIQISCLNDWNLPTLDLLTLNEKASSVALFSSMFMPSRRIVLLQPNGKACYHTLVILLLTNFTVCVNSRGEKLRLVSVGNAQKCEQVLENSECLCVQCI